MRFLGLFIFLVFFNNGYTQNLELLNKMRLELNKKPNILLGFDNNYSLVSDEPVRVMGIRYGFDYGKIKLYEGLYFLKEDIVRTKRAGNQLKDTNTLRTNFSYLSTTIEYVFYENKKWELSVPVKIGFGNGTKKTFLGDSLIHHDTPFFIPSEMAVIGLYKITPWAGLSAGFGYRISLYNTNEFDGSFYSFGLKVFLGKLYRTIRNKPL